MNIKDSLPISAQKVFMEVSNSIISKGGTESTAEAVAWNIVKQRFKRVDNQWVAMSESYKVPTLYTFETEVPTIQVVMNSETEEIVMDAILASTETNTEGIKFTEVELVQIAEQINTFGSTLPDVDHEKLMSLVKTYGNDKDRIIQELKREKGIFKSIKAAVKNGNLWIQSVFDKRYKNHVNKFKGLSIEAIGEPVNGVLTNPTYLGFTFTNTPKLKSAQIAI